MALSSAQQISQLYVGYFDRAPDPEGLNYWIGRLNSGEMTINQIAQSFSEQPEALETYPFLRYPNLLEGDTEQFITEIYQNMFNRDPDAEGLAYWTEQLTSGAVPVGDFIASVAGGATNSEAGQDLTTLTNKTNVGVSYAEAVGDAGVQWTVESAHQAVTEVNDTDASVALAEVNIGIFVETGHFPGTEDSYTLTVNTDIASANEFNAPLEYTPGGNDRVNTLQDEDVLTGRGEDPTLNATLGNANDNGGTTITPTLNGVETINARFTGSGVGAVNTLDLQDATGVDEVNITGITDPNNNVAINNLTSVPADLSLANTHSTAGTVGFTFTRAAAAGDADETTLGLSNVEVGTLVVEQNSITPVEGVETINLVSAGAENIVGVLQAEELETLNISGDQDLTLGSATPVRQAPTGRIEAELFQAGLANVSGSLETIDASALEGDLNVVLGGEVNAIKDGTSGVQVEFRYTGAQGDDTVVLTAAVNAGADAEFDGGEGDNTLVVTNSVQAGAYANFQDLDVLGQATGIQNIVVETDLLSELESVSIRNEGQFGGISANQTLTTTLNEVNETVAENISVLHGTSTNNGIADNIINVNTIDDVETVALAIEEGVNVDPRFNVQLNTFNDVENVTLLDDDSESNTVQLGSVANLTGTIEVTGGRDGRFLNLDATANVYGYDVTGGGVDISGTDADGTVVQNVPGAAAERIVAAEVDASEFEGDLVARVSSGAASAVGAQTITAGSGNDTIIFDALNNVTAGLTIADTVTGGEGDDTLAFGGDVAVTLGASEWTNVSEFEALRLLGNGAVDNNAQGAINAYNLTLTNELVNENGVADGNLRSIAIINNNDQNQSIDVAANGAAGANSGVTIDATGLAANRTFSYDGADGANVTADRFILSDANINSSAVIDGGAIFVAGSGVGSNVANADVLEVRNASTVTVADLANISNVGTIEFTNSTTVTQNNQIVLDSATVDRLVNDTAAATTITPETLTVTAYNSQSGALTSLDLQAGSVEAPFNLNVTGAGAADVLITGAGNDIINGGAGADVIDAGAGNDVLTGGAGADTLTGGVGADVFNYGSLAQLVVDTGITQTTSDLITDFVSGTDTIQTGVAGTAANYREAASVADYATALANANAVFDGTVQYYLTSITGGEGLLFVDADANNTADSMIRLTGIDHTTFDFADIV